jgi:hypothetical protein
MLKRLRYTPSIIYIFLSVIILFLVFTFFSFGISEQQVLDGYKSISVGTSRLNIKEIISQVSSAQKDIEEQKRTSYMNMSKTEVELISMKESEAWSYISDGKITSKPTQSFIELESLLNSLYNSYSTTMKVKVWFWEDPKDNSNMNKVTKELSVTVNKKLEPLWEGIFNTIYSLDSKPIINVQDSAMGAWSVRGKLNNLNKAPSSHAFGTAIDINPSTGTVTIDGQQYGNGYNQKILSKSKWESLPENHVKYQILYDDCPIVQVFKAYSFTWGGDWNSAKDNMHFSFIGDLDREDGYNNYLKYWRELLNE